MKNKLKVLCFVFLCGLLFVGCEKKSNVVNEKKSIICTTFPQFDWIKNIVGSSNSVKLDLLVDSGVDVHSYNPTPKDIVQVSKCDLFVYSGGVSESWVFDILKQGSVENTKLICLSDFLEEKNRLVCVPEGKSITGSVLCDDENCLTEHNHNHEEEVGHEHHNHNHSHSHNHDFDEHIWLSLENAVLCVQLLCENLCSLDFENADLYRKNAKDYVQKLVSLDEQYKIVVNSSKRNYLLFADRFPFVYLTNDYGLNVFAAFVGCSAETEASFETLAFLTNKIDDHKRPYLMILENSNSKIADTLIKNSKEKNQQVLVLNSIQSCTQTQIEQGLSYFDVMESNLKVLEKALN